MTDIEIRSARTSSEVERTAVAAGHAFTDVPDAEFHRRIVDAPALPVENTLLGLDGDELVTSLQLYERQCWLDGAPVPVAGVGNVQTAPDRRGEGHASTLLNDARSFAVDKGYPLVALVGDPGFYSRLGWHPLDAASTVVTDPERIAVADGGGPGRWEPFDPDDPGLDAVATIHRAERRGVDGAFNRYPALWRDWVFEVLVAPENVYRYVEDGEQTGYLVCERSDDATACLEVGYRGDDRESFLARAWNLLAASPEEGLGAAETPETATATGPTSLRWDPPLDTLERPLRSVGVDRSRETVRERTGETPMLWAASDLLAAATGGAFDDAETVGDSVLGTDRWFPALDKF